jgi:DNA-binding CsgD family transcriptional regulator
MDKARKLVAQSAASLASGATVRAVSQARAALELSIEGQAGEAGEHQALQALGTALWSRGDLQDAALVLGAADSVREQTGSGAEGPLDDLAARYPGWQEGRQLSAPDVLSWLRAHRDARGNPTQGWHALTAAERQVVELAATGLTNPAIARELFLSPNTVKTHLLKAYRKLGVRSREDLRQAPR